MTVAKTSVDVTAVGSKVTAIYEPVVENLQRVRQLAADFGRDVAVLGDDSGAGVPSPASDLDAADPSTALSSLCALMAASVAAIGAEEIDTHLRDLRSNCQGLKTSGRELNALSSLMLITAAGASSDVAAAGLVGELRRLSDGLVQESERIGRVVKEVNATRQTSRQSLEEAQAVTETHVEAMRAAADQSGPSVSDPTASQDLEPTAQALSRSVAAIMPRIIACMQHPDAFAQRCDHIDQILAIRMAADRSAADCQVLAALARAQIADARQELDQVQQDTGLALRDIADASDRTVDAFEEALRQDGRLAAMNARQLRLKDTRTAVQDIKVQADAAMTDLADCHASFAKIADVFDRLDGMRQAVQLSSLNADLCERKSEKNAPEIRSVTKAVAEFAMSCGETIETLNGSFRALTGLLSDEHRTELDHGLDLVSQHLETASTEVETLSADVRRVQDAQNACAKTLEALVSTARLAGSQIAANSLTLKELEQMEAVLAAEAGPGVTLPAVSDDTLMGTIFATYTMERERDVHRALLGSEGETQADPAPPEPAGFDEDDPLAGVMF